MSAPPDWAGSESKPAPMPLLLLQSFVNTLDSDEDTDELATADATRSWMAAAGLIDEATTVSEAEAARARAVREALRDLIAGDATRDDLEPLRAVADERRLRLSVEPSGTLDVEAPTRGDVVDGLLALLLIARDGQRSEDWSRLKACADPTCRWVFYDASRNRQGAWCSMATCGNRSKNRDLRARRRE